jgi:DNA polymerase elongation subunit (family B)
MYFSEELYNAKKYGYKYNIKSGYLFDRYNVFSKFIDNLSYIKENSAKTDAWYTISKLLMNSLYGRFGMNPNFESHSIIDSEELDNYMDNYEVSNWKDLINNKLLFSYKDMQKNENNNLLSLSHKSNINVSIPIASAITSYARIFMSKYKNNSKYKILYTDTDSVFIDGELDSSLVGNKLGQWKLENSYIKFVTLAPKVYGGITDKGEEITKVKGFKNKVSFNDLEKLLNKNKILKLNQTK